MKKQFKPDTMKYISYVTWPEISGNGERIAWVSWTGDEKSGAFTPSVHLLEEEKEACLTRDGIGEKQPLFLPDGVHMAYLSDQSGEYQVWLRNLETGQTRQITTLRHGVLRYALSDDGTKLVFEATLWPEEVSDGTALIEMTPEEKKAWKEELDWRPYEITDLTYKMDEWNGMRKGEYSHIGTAELSKGNARIIGTGEMEAVFPSWSHDGKLLAFYGYPYSGAKGRRAELFVCSEDGGGLRQLTADAWVTPDHAPAFTTDNSAVISMAYGDFDDGSCVLLPLRTKLADASSAPLPGEWGEGICHGVYPLRAGSLEYGDKTPYFRLTGDGQFLYFLSGWQGRFGLYRISLTEKEAGAECVADCPTDIQEFAMDKKGRLVTVAASWKQPAELWMDGRQLTHSNDWLEDYELADVEERWVTSKDGKARLQYFLARPAGFEPGRQYPAVLDIKGGPETMYGLTFWHEFQALAGAGMAVIFGNPRGSVGFGRAYCADGVCWEPEAMEDLLLFAEDAASLGWIDKKRVGVTGGSYGGYMTNKLIGRTDAFAAAVTQRCLANTATSYGTGDMGFVSSRPVPKHFRMLDYLEGRARGNIISYIDHFKVPLLILHAYEDYRCGFEQAEQVFIPMKERNPEVPVRLVMFPGENHGMTRSGKLYHQIRHLQEMTDWFVRYLEEMPDWKTRKQEEEDHE